MLLLVNWNLVCRVSEFRFPKFWGCSRIRNGDFAPVPAGQIVGKVPKRQTRQESSIWVKNRRRVGGQASSRTPCGCADEALRRGFGGNKQFTMTQQTIMQIAIIEKKMVSNNGGLAVGRVHGPVQQYTLIQSEK